MGVTWWIVLATTTIVVTGILRLEARYRTLVERNRCALAQGSEVIQTEAGTVEVATTETGFPVLISHDGAGGYDQGLMTVSGFLGDGLMGITPSRFGYLRTLLAADSSASAQADGYAHLLDALEIERVAILGVSGGGPSASLAAGVLRF